MKPAIEDHSLDRLGASDLCFELKQCRSNERRSEKRDPTLSTFDERSHAVRLLISAGTTTTRCSAGITLGVA
jgi:hypothetical protein